MSTSIKRGLSDGDIVDGILAGGRKRDKAIEAIYTQNRSFLIKFLSNRSNTKDYVKQPEDIIWEAVEALVHNIIEGRYVPQSSTSLSAYLTTICKNLWHKFLSQESNREDRDDKFAKEIYEDEPDISVLLTEKERWDRYLAIFEKAGKHCKQIFTLWLVEGMSGKEMSDILISEGKLKSEQSVRNAKSDCLEKVTSQLMSR
ncbi:RNA polymerase sigma factor [Runella limosa]|uniref:RNA polymerase sigma factor n=1 Tax=Runella limosa TaxID=370978 RepID=UPI00048BC725|nr:sigma-70 family RNA polymerase sigma factor [Runella limosa]